MEKIFIRKNDCLICKYIAKDEEFNTNVLRYISCFNSPIYIKASDDELKNSYISPEEMLEILEKEKTELEKFENIETKINQNVILKKNVRKYIEIIKQLNYFDSTKNNKNLYQYYIIPERELRKAKHRKEKIFHRYLTKSEVETLIEYILLVLNRTRYCNLNYVKNMMKNIENKIEKLQKLNLSNS